MNKVNSETHAMMLMLLTLLFNVMVVASIDDHQHNLRSGGTDYYYGHRGLTCPPPEQQMPVCGPNCCWCDDTGAISTCPNYPEESIYLFKPTIPDFLDSLKLDNPGHHDLQLCHPDLTSSVNLDEVSIGDPFILFTEGILEDVDACDSKHTSSSNDSGSDSSASNDGGYDQVCGIQFKHDGDPIDPKKYAEDCDSSEIANSYKVRTFDDHKERKKAGYFILHEGACGVCSTTQDLASYMRNSIPAYPDAPTLAALGFFCQMAVTSTHPPDITPKELVASVSECFQNGFSSGPFAVPSADLSENCAYAWAINVYLTGLPSEDGGCNEICSEMLGLINTETCSPVSTIQPPCPYNAADCQLHDCLQCDDSVSGQAFIELAGMTRRNAGIHTLLPRPCGSLASHAHTCVALK